MRELRKILAAATGRDRHERQRELEDWRLRRGRFAGLDPDTPDRPQVMPVPEPPPERQVHGLSTSMIRRVGDGS